MYLATTKKFPKMNAFEITICPEAGAVINKDGRASFPNECCGFLYGTDSPSRTITEAIPVTNTKPGDQRRRFEISPSDYMKAEQYALAKGLQLLGVYHSHPNHPAIASKHDLAVAMPYFSYVIVSVMAGKIADLKSWRLKETEAKEFAEEVVLSVKQNLEI